ncbi:cell division protein ZapA [Nitrosovibrio sp. Nv17]|uniref:cell division protein ZapA n=1 Tax=Nitrosovibrio sp. Nv17 TaxID=1855339 RepID=UPI00090900B4|nr:cell division protein ZapA [Nitrosovibrio sp. Nv17]SFW17843.1 cell division protein ZapA [Nitrosovibrio sp. Nv17]
MKTSTALNVAILGREFRVTCPEDEREELLQAVAYLDERMRSIRDTGKVVGTERIAIMAALNITHELLASRKKGGFDMEAFKRRIVHMQMALDAAMPTQDRLL